MNMATEFIRTHKISLVAFVIFVLALLVFFGNKQEKPIGKNPHAEHLKMIADIRSGMREDSNYSLDLDKSKIAKAGALSDISFAIKDSKGNPVTDFQINNDKILHLIVVNEALTYFDHVHPAFDGEKFSQLYTFLKDDSYRIYADFRPLDKYEKQASVIIPIGTKVDPKPVRDYSLSKTFGKYSVSLESTFSAAEINKGTSHFTFTITDAKTGAPVKDLRKYLNAFGHLVMINEDTHEYIHAHPINQTLVDDRSGPTVEFIPLSLKTGELAPGRYRLFAQFQPTSGLFTADFSVDIK